MSGVFLDTNILLYSISTDLKESAKRRVALRLLENDASVLSVQVLQEFYVQATRASRQTPLAHDIAASLVRVWLRFRVQDMTATVMQQAFDLKARTNYSYWDCAILAAATASGCHTVFSEDLQHGHRLDGMEILDPFR